ncbi:MAG: GNAT family N-acetyltransferase [Burkholderiales bacterium]
MSGPTDGYRVDVMTEADVVLAMDWAAAEGWNPGLHDAPCFRAADPGGFLVGRLDGEPIATISVVRYGASFAFLGLYIVAPAHRGNGYGLRLWRAGLARAAGRTVGLDGVVAQQDNYRKSGFALAYRNIRYQGPGGSATPLDPRIVPLSSRPRDEVIAYDRPFFPDDRTAFLRAWLAQPRARGLAIADRRGLAGYGVVRPCRRGWKVGPLCADAPELAEALLAGLAAFVPSDAPLFLDAPEPNAAAVALAERRGMTVAFETARMYAGRAPHLPLRRLFGVTTFELG